MNKGKNKRRELFEVINDVKKVIDDNNMPITENEVDKINALFSEASDINKSKALESKINKIVITITLVMCIFMFIISLKINKLDDKQIILQSKIIKTLQLNNDILSKYVWGEKDKATKLNDSINLNISVDSKGKILTYSALKTKLDSMENLSFNKAVEIGLLKIKLNAIKEFYGISINNQMEILAPKVDSALMIYPVYKDSLRYDKIKKGWYIYH